MDEYGNNTWGVYYGSVAEDFGLSIDVSLDASSIYVGGYTKPNLVTGNDDVIAFKLSATDGTKLWSMRFGGTGGEECTVIRVTSDN
jgi:hypothetical protein